MSSSLFPSKTFLCGEYAVLEGGDALVLAHSPFFRAENSHSPTQGFHPQSPAGLLAQAHHISTSHLRFWDPHLGRGGFGGSGAEFLSVFERINHASNDAFAWAAYDEYKKLGLPGSGVDILSQAFGRNRSDQILHISQNLRKIESFNENLGLHFVLFHTGKKLTTHNNLGKPSLPLSRMQNLTLAAWDAIQKKDTAAFAQSLQTYGETLAALGLVAPHTQTALSTLPKSPAILAAKGCGAMGSDVILLVLAQDSVDLNSWAQQNSLAQILSLSRYKKS